jgi:hypothetical protein
MEVHFTPETEKEAQGSSRAERTRRRASFVVRFMTEYGFHPEARFDLDEIWEFIRADNNLDAADRVIAEILAAIAALVPFPVWITDAPDLTYGFCASFGFVNT